MSRISLKQFALQNGYNAVSKVRVNTNGYKYITMADTTGTIGTENLYLGTRFAETVEIGAVANLDWFVIETENSVGEKRFKITDKSSEMSAEKLAEYQTF